MKRSSLLIVTLVAFGIYGCGEPPAPQKKAATESQTGPAKPSEPAPASPSAGPAKPEAAAPAAPAPAAPAGDMKKDEKK